MKSTIANQTRNLPDFLIVGAGKSGTSSLHHYLAQHPDVVMPSKKETLFFHITTNTNKAQLRFVQHAITKFETYLNQFDSATANQICGEACPSYLFFYEHTIANIQRYHPRWQDLKIIIILREPVDKVISQYFFVKNKLGKRDSSIRDRSLKTAIAREGTRRSSSETLVDLFYVQGASYYEQVKAYVDVFPQTKIYLYDDLKSDSHAFFEDLCGFLGIRQGLAAECVGQQRVNVGKRIKDGKLRRTTYNIAKSKLGRQIASKCPQWIRQTVRKGLDREERIPERLKKQLKETFRDDVHKLEQLLDRDLSSLWGY